MTDKQTTSNALAPANETHALIQADELVATLLRGVLSLVPGGGVIGELAGLGLLVAGRLDRMRQTALRMAAEAGGPEPLLERIRSSEEVEVLALEALDHASRSPLQAKRRLLAQVVARAVLDDARVDEGRLMLEVLKDLEAPHIRALDQLDHLMRPGAMKQRRDAGHPTGNVPPKEWDQPAPVVAALVSHGCVYEMRAFTGGGISGYYLTDFGHQLLADLRTAADGGIDLA